MYLSVDHTENGHSEDGSIKNDVFLYLCMYSVT